MVRSNIIALPTFMSVIAALVVWAYRAGRRDIARADAKLAQERRDAVASGALYEPIKRPER